MAFDRVLIERISAEADLGISLARQLRLHNRNASDTGRAFHRHVSKLLREAGVDGDHEMLAHALLAFLTIDVDTSRQTGDYLGRKCRIPTERVQATWAELVRLVT
ncbi:hypothetical protein [Streptomyces sp. 5-6(2022)]|uniref:hypothetical protein n=1 Tax=Streptomyces sp. 5-6(2022) TaxID=2936510 RepID=UPI0023B9125C|nr:hypothetical protein [Streptomyces sp. 5-6(2022)]